VAIPQNTRVFIEAHRHCKAPYIDSLPEIYSGKTIRWKGSNVCLQLYDKSAQVNGRQGDVMRVELQLRSRKLKSLVGKGEPVTLLRFKVLYRVFRRTLWKLQPLKVPKLPKMVHVLAFAERRVPIVDFWAIGKSADRVAKQESRSAT
jgi:hypothetical protein